jgi:hypothetical protein
MPGSSVTRFAAPVACDLSLTRLLTASDGGIAFAWSKRENVWPLPPRSSSVQSARREDGRRDA